MQLLNFIKKKEGSEHEEQKYKEEMVKSLARYVENGFPSPTACFEECLWHLIQKADPFNMQLLGKIFPEQVELWLKYRNGNLKLGMHGEEEKLRQHYERASILAETLKREGLLKSPVPPPSGFPYYESDEMKDKALKKLLGY